MSVNGGPPCSSYPTPRRCRSSGSSRTTRPPSSAATPARRDARGTNELRGSGFLFHRNKDLRAKGFFEQQKGEFKKNDYGTSFGGPIRRDRPFFFFSYEGVREDSGSGQQYTVETEAFRDFVMRTRPNSNAAYLAHAP